MPLLKYTTTINALKTVGEIQGILVAHGASSILIDYDDDGSAAALAFKIPTAHGDIGFRLPINANAVLQILYQQRVISTRNRYDKDCAVKHKEQAGRIAWRILKDWVAAQAAIIETGMVKTEEVFLPYMIAGDGKTLYQALENKGFLLTTGGQACNGSIFLPK